MPLRGRCHDPRGSPEGRAEKAADLTHTYVKEIQMTSRKALTAALFATALLLWGSVIWLLIVLALT